MGTGWKRARNVALGLSVCTSVHQDPSEEGHTERTSSPSPSPTVCANLSQLSSGGSMPRLQSHPVSSPGLRCRTSATNSPKARSTRTPSESPKLGPMNPAVESPRLLCKAPRSPRFADVSNPSSPRSPSRFATLFKNGLRLSRGGCGICVQSMKTGQGGTAIFTAECSHAFHFPCIAAHVKKQGSFVCPVCQAQWKDVPLLTLHKDSTTTTPNSHQPRSPLSTGKLQEGRAYDDDEPLIKTSASHFNPIPEEDQDDEGVVEFGGFVPDPKVASTRSSVEVSLGSEVALVSSHRSHENVAMVLRLKAPQARLCGRAPIDLVAVLDVSGSMSGAKLHMLKRAMRLVVGSLGPSDRLSIVAFSSSSKRLLALRRMSAQGQRTARRVVDRLVCGQGSCVGEALRKAARVLEDRRERNPVASIMLLSDGQNERTAAAPTTRDSERGSSGTRFGHLEIPVHAFGFGNGDLGHKKSTISDGAGSTFSYVQAEDAFARCIGGLLSVVVQDLRLEIHCNAGAELAGVYTCTARPRILHHSTSGRTSGCARLGDLYAQEERELLVELRVPTGCTPVLAIGSRFKDPVTQNPINGFDQNLQIPRPQGLSHKSERLRNRFRTTRAIAEARHLSELGEHTAGQQVLFAARALLVQSTSISADEHLRALEAELAEIQWRARQHQRRTARASEGEGGAELGLMAESGEALTPTSAWRAAERLAKVAIMRKSMNRVSDLHGFENARF
ncbi:hypothetical protein AMTRI_Chr13g89900 [Amborella trichopoda]